MDPYQAYLDMYQAMKHHDFTEARESALALRNWFASGGFCPYQVTPIAMQAYLGFVLRRTAYLEYLPQADE